MASYHVRSTSFPCASHPLIDRAEKLLERLKSSQVTSTSSICYNLNCLVDLYDSVDNVLHLSQSQFHGKCVEDVLDRSIRLLDFCGSIKDALSQMKESVQEIESSIRRKRCNSGFSSEVSAYMILRKKLNKLICKSFGDLMRMDKRSSTTNVLDKDSLSSMLREIEGVTFTMFDSLLTFMSQKKARSKSLSFFSKLLQPKQVSWEAYISEVEILDIDLLALKSKRPTLQVQDVVKKLKVLELNIEELEEGLEAVFRRLVKTRVSLLNILNH